MTAGAYKTERWYLMVMWERGDALCGKRPQEEIDMPSLPTQGSFLVVPQEEVAGRNDR